MRIYLDNCCFNRPFDDPGQIRIRLQAEAKLFIQQQIIEKRLERAWSYILDFENSAYPFPERKTSIARWKSHATFYVVESAALLVLANAIQSLGVAPKDPPCCLLDRSQLQLFYDNRRPNIETPEGIARHLQRQTKPPGMTCLWQTSRNRNDVRFED